MINSFPYKKIKGRLYWSDARSETGWSNTETMKELKLATCVTSGWIFEETEDYLKTFSTYSIDENGDIEFGEILIIPKPWVIK
jgi:Ca2+-binding EF-hand superfamily protein